MSSGNKNDNNDDDRAAIIIMMMVMMMMTSAKRVSGTWGTPGGPGTVSVVFLVRNSLCAGRGESPCPRLRHKAIG
jgi:hypothetical protein